jgi:hypothetical protein
MRIALLFLMMAGCMSCSITDKPKEKLLSDKMSQDEVLLSVQMTMDEQIMCWNSGDIVCFMEAYWKSDSLLFIGKSGVNYGWQKTVDNYRVSYPDSEAMGKLTFENEVMQFIDNKTIQVVGKWHLERDVSLGDLKGYYSLLWQQKDGKWVIISDHSS